MLTVVYDLDGVLIDSEWLVRWSYELAGVTPPSDILAWEGDDWLRQATTCPDDVRRDKARYYRRMVHICARMPAFDVAVDVHSLHRHDAQQCVMSGAPSGTLRTLRRRIGWTRWPFDGPCLDGVRTPEKMRIIKTMPGPGVYIDDQDRYVDLPADWRFIRYTGQSVTALKKEIMP